MKMMHFAKRCAREILRDPVNLGFGLGFPVILLLLLTAIQANIPVSLFEIDTLTPGISVFGLSFMALFSATLVAKDRESAFLQRLYTTPLTGFGYLISEGIKKAVDEKGFLGIFTGGITAAAGGISAALIFGYLAAIIFKGKTK